MNIYVDQLYFDVLEQLRNTLPKDNLSNNKAQNLKSIYNLFLSLNIHTDITRDEVIENYKKGIGGKDYKTIKELILFAAVKSKIVTDVDLSEIKDYSAYYFIQDNHSCAFAAEYGIVKKDENFDCTNFYENCTVSDLKFKGNINELKEFLPPANAMIIVDNYIFDKPFEEKLINLIGFVKLYINQLSKIKFQLTLFTDGNNNPHYITKAFKELSKIENCETQIISTNNKSEFRDRQIYTNYATINFGHPFENKETHFSQNLLGVEIDISKIKLNYENFILHLKKYKLMTETTPPMMGLLQSRWENEDVNKRFKNRLFDLIK